MKSIIFCLNLSGVLARVMAFFKNNASPKISKNLILKNNNKYGLMRTI